MKNLLITLSIALTLCSCQKKQIELTENFTDSFSAYLEEIHSLTIEDNLYIIIPANSCDGCRQIVYRNLLSTKHEKTISLILTGPVEELKTEHYLTRLDIMGVKILRDQEGLAKDYGIVHEKFPMSLISFTDVKSGKLNYVKVMEPSMINGEVDIRKHFFNNYIE